MGVFDASPGGPVPHSRPRGEDDSSRDAARPSPAALALVLGTQPFSSRGERWTFTEAPFLAAPAPPQQ